MQIKFNKQDLCISHDEDRETVTIEGQNDEGYGVNAIVTYNSEYSAKSGDGYITPITQDVSYSGFDLEQFDGYFINTETDDIRPLTVEEEVAMIDEVIEWAINEVC